MTAKLDADNAARMLVEATQAGDEATAKKHGISVRSLQRWRKRLENDSRLSQAVAEKKVIADGDWAAKLPTAIGAGVDFLIRAMASNNTDDPDMVHAVTGAIKILSEVGMSREMLDARMARQAEQAREQDRIRAAGTAGAKVVAIR